MRHIIITIAFFLALHTGKGYPINAHFPTWHTWLYTVSCNYTAYRCEE